MKTNDEIGASVEPLRKLAEDGWIQEGHLLYRLTDERTPKNRDEINVLMADGSRTEEARTRRAGELLDAIRAAAPQAVQAAVPEGWKLVPIKVPDSAFAWVSGGYPAGYKAWDERDTAVVHERAQRAWEAILNGITAPAPAAVAVPDERAAFEAWLGIKPCGAAHDFGWAAWQARAALAATQPAAQGVDALDAAPAASEQDARTGKWLTVVYRDVAPGDESREIGSHPKVSALSWSHALNDRDAAIAAKAKQGEQP